MTRIDKNTKSLGTATPRKLPSIRLDKPAKSSEGLFYRGLPKFKLYRYNLILGVFYKIKNKKREKKERKEKEKIGE